MELVKFCMESLVWFLGMEKSNNKPFFFFFMNLGLNEPYLVYWWCLAVLD